MSRLPPPPSVSSRDCAPRLCLSPTPPVSPPPSHSAAGTRRTARPRGPGPPGGGSGVPGAQATPTPAGGGPGGRAGRWGRCAARRPRDPGLHSRPGLGPAWRAPTAGRTGNSRSSAESAAGVPGGAGSPPAGRGRSREAEGAFEHRVPRGLRVHHGRGTSGSRLEMRSRAAGHLVGRVSARGVLRSLRRLRTPPGRPLSIPPSLKEMAPTQKVRWNLRAVTLSP